MKWLCLVQEYHFSLLCCSSQGSCRSPRSVIFSLILSLERRKATALKLRSTNYDVGKAIKYLLTLPSCRPLLIPPRAFRTPKGVGTAHFENQCSNGCTTLLCKNVKYYHLNIYIIFKSLIVKFTV